MPNIVPLTSAPPVITSQLKLEVDTEPGIRVLLIAVDGQDVPLQNGHATISLASGKHTVDWRAVGEAGAGFDIRGTIADTLVTSVKDRVIGAMGSAAGVKAFLVP